MTGIPTSVGFVIEGMSGPGSGVWTRFVSLVQGLSGAGVHVHALASATHEAALAGLPLTSATLVPARSRARRLLVRGSEVVEFARSCGLDLVYLETPPLPRLRGLPTIASIHDLRGMHGRSGARMSAQDGYQRIALKRQIVNMGAVAVLSSWVGREVEALLGVPGDRIHIIPPIVTAPVPSTRPSAPRANPFALVLGHLETRKNVATVVRAAASKDWPDGVELVIAGRDAGEGAALRELATHVRGGVSFLGFVDEATKADLMRTAQMVLVPSLIEGFGIVAVEAPLAGTPALVADASALTDLAATPMALVSPLDPAEWADRVRLIATNADVRASVVAAQMLAAERFTEATVIPRVLAMHDAVTRA